MDFDDLDAELPIRDAGSVRNEHTTRISKFCDEAPAHEQSANRCDLGFM